MALTGIVRGARSENEVGAYLPANFCTTGAYLENDRVVVTIEGNDSQGWTMNDYVIPRLASGLMFVEVTS